MSTFERFSISCIALLSIFVYTPAIADGNNETDSSITFIPSIAYQHKRLKFEQKLRFPVDLGTDAKFDVILPTANISLTAAINKLFITLKYETSLSSGTTETEETLQPDDLQHYFNIPGGITEVDREDINITVGYNVVGSLNIFSGYMKGTTEIQPDIGCSWAPADVPQTCDNDNTKSPGTFNPNGKLNLAWTQRFFSFPTYKQTYTEQGPYIGFSYAWQIADTGTLSFSAAYAKMNGKYEDNYATIANLDFGFKGNSTGTSFGLTWTAPLGENSNYFVDIRQQNYSMDADKTNSNFPGATAETEETMTGLTAGIQYYF